MDKWGKEHVFPYRTISINVKEIIELINYHLVITVMITLGKYQWILKLADENG